MATNYPEKRTSIKLKESTIKKLKSKGNMSETYDELINRLMFEEKNKISSKADYEDKI